MKVFRSRIQMHTQKVWAFHLVEKFIWNFCERQEGDFVFNRGNLDGNCSKMTKEYQGHTGDGQGANVRDFK